MLRIRRRSETFKKLKRGVVPFGKLADEPDEDEN
jgi:hypothetical protein